MTDSKSSPRPARRVSRYQPYNMSEEDRRQALEWLEKHYLGRSKRTLSNSYIQYIGSHWSVFDSDGNLMLFPEVQRPFFHQFKRLLTENLVVKKIEGMRSRQIDRSVSEGMQPAMLRLDKPNKSE